MPTPTPSYPALAALIAAAQSVVQASGGTDPVATIKVQKSAIEALGVALKTVTEEMYK